MSNWGERDYPIETEIDLPEWAVDMEQMLSRFKEGRLYTSKYAGIRELVQNAIDSKTANIDITLDREQIKVVDKGIGMSNEDVRNYLLTIFRTSKTAGDIGEFGIGFLSAFVIAESIELGTKKRDTRDQPVGLLFRGVKDIRFVPCDRKEGGTTVTLFGQFDVSEITEYLRTLCAYLQVPVYLNNELISQKGFTKKEPSIRVEEPEMRGLLYVESEERAIKLLSHGLFISDYAPQYPIAGYIDYPGFKLTLSRDEIMRDNPEYRSFQRRLRKYRDLLMRGLDEVYHRDELVDFVSRSKQFDLVEDKKIFTNAYGRPTSISEMKEEGEVFFASTRDDAAVDEALREGKQVILAPTKAAQKILADIASTVPQIHSISEYQVPVREWKLVAPMNSPQQRLLQLAQGLSAFPVHLMDNTDREVVGQYSVGKIYLNISNQFIQLLLEALKRGFRDETIKAVLSPVLAHEETHGAYTFHNELFFTKYDERLTAKLTELLRGKSKGSFLSTLVK